MSSDEVGAKLAEAIRKFEDPTPEEERENKKDERRISEELMRVCGRGFEEELERAQNQVFECRMCGCNEYITTHTKSNGVLDPGDRTLVIEYECKGCFYPFNDVAEFSNK